MSLCSECKSISTRTFGHESTTWFRHDHDSLRKAVFESKCYICCRVWDSLTVEQKEVASRPQFMGIEYHLRLWNAVDSDGDANLNVASLRFKWDDDLYDCEDYNEPGGLHVEEVGKFTILNPASMFVHYRFSTRFSDELWEHSSRYLSLNISRAHDATSVAVCPASISLSFQKEVGDSHLLKRRVHRYITTSPNTHTQHLHTEHLRN